MNQVFSMSMSRFLRSWPIHVGILVGFLTAGLHSAARFTIDSALLAAVKEGDVSHAERCLQRGANIETSDHESIDSPAWREDGYTPLALAIARRDRTMAAMLLAHGANVQAKDKAQYGFPARDIVLSTAVETGQTDMVRVLLDKGADVDVEIGMHCTPLMIAARDNRLEIAKLLLDRGANVNARDDRGFRVIDFATGKRRQNHASMLNLLRCAGAK